MKAILVVLISIVAVALAVVLLGVKVFFVKGGRFPAHHHRHQASGRHGSKK